MVKRVFGKILYQTSFLETEFLQDFSVTVSEHKRTSCTALLQRLPVLWSAEASMQLRLHFSPKCYQCFAEMSPPGFQLLIRRREGRSLWERLPSMPLLALQKQGWCSFGMGGGAVMLGSAQILPVPPWVMGRKRPLCLKSAHTRITMVCKSDLLSVITYCMTKYAGDGFPNTRHHSYVRNWLQLYCLLGCFCPYLRRNTWLFFSSLYMHRRCILLTEVQK